VMQTLESTPHGTRYRGSVYESTRSRLGAVCR
jgi:hypothetical protein